MEKISFFKPYQTGRELSFLKESLAQGHLSGDGPFTRKCQDFFQQRYKTLQTYLTTSCTDALEMAALLTKVGPGDEVIVPSYTSPSTANAFLLRGAKIVFIDSRGKHPNLDVSLLEDLITPKTKVIVVVHYAGLPVEMEQVMEIASNNNILVVEDAAQAIESTYKGKQLGTIGDLGTFSFHETKNISSGEGGLLLINRERFLARAEILWQMGTNRLAFKREEVTYYEWKDIGSSFFPSDLIASLLYCQLNSIEKIMEKRERIWQYYQDFINPCDYFKKGKYKGNYHNYYLLFSSKGKREYFQVKLRELGIPTASHFVPLSNCCPNSVNLFETLLRIPFYTDLEEQQAEVVKVINSVTGPLSMHY